MARNYPSQYGLLEHGEQLHVKQSCEPAMNDRNHEGPAQGQRRLPHLVSAWYLPVLHLTYAVLFTAGVISWLNGKLFSTSDTNSSKTRLSQADVTTVISACLVVARIIAGAWQTLAAWRCFFILSEKTEISLSDINRVVSWRLPSGSMLRPRASNRAAMITRYTAALVLVAIWPAQLMNPVASGAISWIPTYAYDTLEPTPAIGMAFNGSNWGWYVDYTNVRQLLVRNSAGLANLARGNGSKEGTEPRSTYSAQRMLSQFNNYPDKTLVENATVPAFHITSFEWITNATEIPMGILSAVQAQDSGFLNISDSGSPLGQTFAGSAALLKDHPWKKPSYTLPQPRVVNETMFAALYLSREWNAGKGSKYKCPRETSVFGSFSGEIINVPAWNNYSDCIAIAKVHIIAGVSHCHQNTTALSDSLMLSSGVLRADNTTVSPDSLVSEVFAMMPEVQTLGAALGFNDKSMVNQSESYLRHSLAYAYQGTWSALVEFFSNPENSLGSRAQKPYQLLQANVSMWRMYLWLGVNLLAALCGLLLLQMQSTCKNETVTEPIIAALTMKRFTEISGR